MNKIKIFYKENISLKEFYESFQILFFYLNKNKNGINIEENLNCLSDTIPKGLNLSDDFINFLNVEGKFFKFNKIFAIYLYFEHIYFALQYRKHEEEFNKGMDAIDIEKILNIFHNFELKNEFIKALRRYITRYILENKSISDIKDENIIKEFYKSDLWGIQQIHNFEEIKNILDNHFKYFDIKIGEALGLYEFYGEEDKEFVKNLIKEIENDDENIEEEPDDDDDELL